MRSQVADTESPTRETQPAGYAPGAVPPGEERFPTDAETSRHVAVRERQVVRDKRRRALAVLDAAAVVRRVLRIAVWTLAAIIALSIAFHLLTANPHNSVVSIINDWAGTVAGPFAGMFILHSAKATNALDYGIAIVVYVVAAEIVINLIGAAIVPVRRRAGATGDPVYPPAGPPPSYPQYQ